MDVKLRTYPAPASVGGGTYTLDELEVLSFTEGELSTWAGKTYRRERDNVLRALHSDTALPRPVVAEDEFGHEFVYGLEYEDKGVYTAYGWEETETLIASGGELSADDAAFIARAFHDGIERVYIRPVIPAAWLTDQALTAAAIPTARDGLPDDAVITAVVDELDKNAVLDLIALAPGPQAWRRHDGEWKQDSTWLTALKSVKPPPLVKIDDENLLAGVIEQVDTATAGKPFDKEEEKEEEEEEVSTVLAAALTRDIEQANTEAAIEQALVAAKGGRSLANKAAGAERLRQYWLHGKGAAKIRWGTPGDWTRCVRNLSKYLGPRAKGYCQLMHGRSTGTWAGRNHSKVPSPEVKAQAVAKQLSR
jgi:hypothetical protein